MTTTEGMSPPPILLHEPAKRPFQERPLLVKPSLLLLALSLASCSPAADPAAEIAVADAWARPTMPGRMASAAYLTISNGGRGDDVLTGISSSNGRAELHSVSMAGGVMRMRRLDRLAVPAGAQVKLEPGSTHLMLTELQQPLEPGAAIELGLRFEKSGVRKVVAEARENGARM